jgi:hypothetical protein
VYAFNIMSEEEWSLYQNASLLINIRSWILRVFERCLSKNCGCLSRFFTLKILIFGRYVFIIVLFVTLIARFLFYVVCFHVSVMLITHWIILGFGSVHMSQKWLWYSPRIKCFLNQEIQQHLQHRMQEGLFFLLILQNTKNPLELIYLFI